MKYRKKPIVIEAFRYNIDPRPDWFQDKVTSNDIVTYPDNSCWIKTLEGDMQGLKGDYIIKGVGGEIYPCKPEIFGKFYELLKCEHESDEMIYASNPPQLRCKKCGEFYK